MLLKLSRLHYATKLVERKFCVNLWQQFKVNLCFTAFAQETCEIRRCSLGGNDCMGIYRLSSYMEKQ